MGPGTWAGWDPGPGPGGLGARASGTRDPGQWARDPGQWARDPGQWARDPGQYVRYCVRMYGIAYLDKFRPKIVQLFRCVFCWLLQNEAEPTNECQNTMYNTTLPSHNN